MHPKDISIHDFTYELPPDRIAAFPLTERDGSRLLVYENGAIREEPFKNIAASLQPGSMLVFNDTRVIPARILFQKNTGAFVEIFCLEPYGLVTDYATVMQTRGKMQWKCLIGGASKWKEGALAKTVEVGDRIARIKAKLVAKLPDAWVSELSWEPATLTFAEIIEAAGDTPLPPYIKRKPENEDRERYQTIYARHEGSVAAPTAGLHFTPAVMQSLAEHSIETAYCTLHVGAGTFKPVKTGTMQQHEMHAEWIDVNRKMLVRLVENEGKMIVAVGTTSLRTLESLYWMGVKLCINLATNLDRLGVTQWEVYEPSLSETQIRPAQAIGALLQQMEATGRERLITQTQILMAPGYKFRVARALVTNFHQPQSTLLLLVAAAIGPDWRILYEYALKNGFRFLSYGDSSLLIFPQR